MGDPALQDCSGSFHMRTSWRHLTPRILDGMSWRPNRKTHKQGLDPCSSSYNHPKKLISSALSKNQIHFLVPRTKAEDPGSGGSKLDPCNNLAQAFLSAAHKGVSHPCSMKMESAAEASSATDNPGYLRKLLQLSLLRRSFCLWLSSDTAAVKHLYQIMSLLLHLTESSS